MQNSGIRFGRLFSSSRGFVENLDADFHGSGRFDLSRRPVATGRIIISFLIFYQNFYIKKPRHACIHVGILFTLFSYMSFCLGKTLFVCFFVRLRSNLADRQLRTVGNLRFLRVVQSDPVSVPFRNQCAGLERLLIFLFLIFCIFFFLRRGFFFVRSTLCAIFFSIRMVFFRV